MKQNSFNNSRKYGEFGVYVVDFTLNTLRTLELANVLQLFTFIWKHYHTQWSPNIIQWFMHTAIMKYVIQGPECVKHGIKQLVPNFTSFFKLLRTSVSWKVQISFLSIVVSTITQMPKYIGKATTCTFYHIHKSKL